MRSTSGHGIASHHPLVLIPPRGSTTSGRHRDTCAFITAALWMHGCGAVAKVVTSLSQVTGSLALRSLVKFVDVCDGCHPLCAPLGLLELRVDEKGHSSVGLLIANHYEHLPPDLRTGHSVVPFQLGKDDMLIGAKEKASEL